MEENEDSLFVSLDDPRMRRTGDVELSSEELVKVSVWVRQPRGLSRLARGLSMAKIEYSLRSFLEREFL